MQSATPSGQKADDWIRTSMSRFTKPAPDYSATSATKHERKDLNPVRQFWRLSALPGAHSCKAPLPVTAAEQSLYVRSSTFQYASLTNFDQLFIRISCDA